MFFYSVVKLFKNFFTIIAVTIKSDVHKVRVDF